MTTTLQAHASALLRAHPVRGVKAPDLARVLAACDLKRLSPGDALCSEGEPGDAMFFVLDGTVVVTRQDPSGQPRELARIPGPAVVGHMALIDQSKRSATCTAGDRTVVATLSRATWARLIQDRTPSGTALRRLLCASLTRQLVGANAQIRSLLGDAPQQAVLGGKGHIPAGPVPSVRSAHLEPEVEAFDATDSELLRVAGVLEGWKVDADTVTQADRVRTVLDEDQKRNPRNPRKG